MALMLLMRFASVVMGGVEEVPHESWHRHQKIGKHLKC